MFIAKGDTSFATVFFSLFVTIPGWYELRGMISKCQKCPPGSYCPGGKAADSHQSMIYECPQGSTSPSGSVSAEACECRRGHFLNVQVSTCSMCPPGYFKNHTGPDLCQTCPPQTVSPEGAIALYECSCHSGKIDIDLSENITCAGLTVLEQFVSTAGFLSQTEVLMYSFHGSMSSPESDSLEVVRLNLIDYLVLSARASLHLTPTAGQISYKIMTSEEEEAAKLHAKMDADVFFALASAKESEVTSRSEIAMESLRCPDGLGFGITGIIRSQSDCKCIHGMEPVPDESGLASGCTKCPRGKYKSTVDDSACSSCGGLSTLQEGGISSAACTCPAGYVNEVLDDPANCQPCGQGFFCQGGTHKQACGHSLTSSTETANSESECICASGFFRVESVCEACPKGSFKADIGDGACEPCPAGKWSNESAASHEDACISCMPGATTREEGADEMSLCVRPDGHQLVRCISGKVCHVEITGFNLQDGHRLALSTSSCDSGGKAAVPNVVAQGISKPATSSGSLHVWGDAAGDFSPEGGIYNLCWCANMRDLQCGSLQTDFILSAGQLEVIGPFRNHSLDCVRGQTCLGLRPFQGHQLSIEDRVAVRRACGGSEVLPLALANPNGTGSLSTFDGEFYLTFVNVLLDADEAYTICWCGGSCNTASDFAVPAGHLQVLGPYTNQRTNCFLGQPCHLQNIKGVGLTTGDRIMLRTDCETGPMLPGSPGNGIAFRNEAWQRNGHSTQKA